MADVQEIPLSAIPEDTQEVSTDIIEDVEPQMVEAIQEEIIATPKPKAKEKNVPTTRSKRCQATSKTKAKS